MKSSLPALSTPVTCAPSRLASWIAKEPEPPPAPLTSTRTPDRGAVGPCSAIAPAWGIVDASAKVSPAGLWASAGFGRDGELGEAALEREVVAVHLVTGLEPGDALADGVDPAGDVRAERAARRRAQPAEAGVQRRAAQTLPVAEVDRRRGDLDTHLPGGGRRQSNVVNSQYPGRPVPVVDDRPHDIEKGLDPAEDGRRGQAKER